MADRPEATPGAIAGLLESGFSRPRALPDSAGPAVDAGAMQSASSCAYAPGAVVHTVPQPLHPVLNPTAEER